MNAITVDQWPASQPSTLVVGSGIFAHALAGILRAAYLRTNELRAPKPKNSSDAVIRSLSELRVAFLVLDDGASVHDAVEQNDLIWEWVCGLTAEGDQREIVVVFIIPKQTSPTFETALAARLCISLANKNGSSSGIGFIRRDQPLTLLWSLAASIVPADLISLRSRTDSDARTLAVNALRTAIAKRDLPGIRAAASGVLTAFHGDEYLMDAFCAPPSHRNGRLLRDWLGEVCKGTPRGEDLSNDSQVINWLD